MRNQSISGLRFPHHMVCGDTINLDVAGKTYTYTAPKSHIITDSEECFALCGVFPRQHKAGDYIGTFDGRRYITGEDIAFFSMDQLMHFVRTAEGIPEIGLVTPRP